MKKPLLQLLVFALVFLISGINSSFSQERESANATKPHSKKVKSTTTYLDTYIQQPNVENCFLVTVIFEVKDELGNSIADAIVTLNDVVYAPGNYILNGIEPGAYDYTVAKHGYISAEGEVVVTLENSEHNLCINLAVETFTITFAVADADEGEIADAIITLNGVENGPGIYTFEGIVAGTYDFRVERAGFVPFEDQLIVSGDATVSVVLQMETFTITFAVADANEGEIADAIITLNGVENGPGIYTFEGIVAGTYDYIVEKEGYNTFENQAEVIDQNLTISVVLSLVTSTPVSPLAEQWISVFPNPNSGQFTISVSLKPNESIIWLAVLDPTGRVVYREKENTLGKSFTKVLNLTFLSKGVYYFHVQGSQQTGVMKLIIN